MIKHFISYNIGLPLFDLAKRYHVKQYFEFLRETETWSQERLHEYRNKKLVKLITYSYHNVAFYKRRMDYIGMTPEDFKTTEDLKNMPAISREDIQNNHAEMISTTKNVNHCYRGSSSGSTGEPVIYYHDRGSLSAGLASLYYCWSRAGWNFGDRMLTIWGNPTTVNVEWKRISSKIKSKLFNEIKYPAFKLTDKNRYNEILAIYKRKKIDFVQGYTNAIYLFAEFVKEIGAKIDRCKGVLTTGENLQSFQRMTIEEVLGPVYDFYGCGEIMGIAAQDIEQGNYKLVSPHVVVEYGDIVDEEGGRELIITDLDNRAMPLIRYKIGDAAIPNSDASNFDPHSFKKIIGRVSDIVRFHNGGTLTVPSFFGSRLLKELKGFKQYQIERFASDRLLVKLAVDDRFDEKEYQKVIKSLKEYLPESVKWEISLCDFIPIEKTGKFKLVIDRTTKSNKG